MLIYKITNTLNNKVYIGQTIRTLKERWDQHVNDAFKHDSKYALYEDMRVFGIENFTLEQIDTATNIKELDKKEIYWIKQYDSVNQGYNLTDGGHGGNTYKYKTKEEMKITKEKISITKLGTKNAHAVSVKAYNTITKEELYFNTVKQCQDYFGENNHNFITRRCMNRVIKL